MDNALKFYIDGQWVAPHSTTTLPVINPATEEVIGTVAIGDEQDVDRAVKAARRAFESFSQTSIDERAALLEKIIAVYKRRMPEIAEAVSKEMGAPMSLASAAQAPSGLGHLMHALKALKAFEWEKDVGRSRVVHEAIGVCALITPGTGRSIRLLQRWPRRLPQAAPWCSSPPKSLRSTRSCLPRCCMKQVCRQACSIW